MCPKTGFFVHMCTGKPERVIPFNNFEFWTTFVKRFCPATKNLFFFEITDGPKVFRGVLSNLLKLKFQLF